MPRAKRAFGRPGTRVVPKNWEANHAPVLTTTRTATVDIFGPSAAGAVEVNDDLTVTGSDPTPLAANQTARIQALSSQETRDLVGDQEQVSAGYLVVVDFALDVPFKAVVHVKVCTDTSLVDKRLVVRKIARGSLRWERDLWCVDDLTAPPPD